MRPVTTLAFFLAWALALACGPVRAAAADCGSQDASTPTFVRASDAGTFLVELRDTGAGLVRLQAPPSVRAADALRRQAGRADLDDAELEALARHILRFPPAAAGAPPAWIGHPRQAEARVAVGGRDGRLHLLGTDRNGELVERWSFLPPAGVAAFAAGAPMPLDSTPTVLLGMQGEADFTWLYVGAGSSGQGLFALQWRGDEATLAWWRRPGERITASARMVEAGIGPRDLRAAVTPARLRLPGGGPPRLVMATGGGRSGDAAVQLLDAATGETLWSATAPGLDVPGGGQATHPRLSAAVDAALAAADTDADGFHDRLLFGDLRGNLWRVDLAGPTHDDWTVHRLACLGGDGGPDCARISNPAAQRRFRHAPDLVQVRRGDRRHDAVIIASGDADTDPAVEDALFVVFDDAIAPGQARDRSIRAADYGPQEPDGLSNRSAPCPSDQCPPSPNGWRRKLDDADGVAWASPVVMDGAIYLLRRGDCGADMTMQAYALEDGSRRGSRGTVDASGDGLPAAPISVSTIETSISADGTAPPGCAIQLSSGRHVLETRPCPRIPTYWTFIPPP